MADGGTMRTALVVMIVVFIVAILAVSLMAGAGEPTDPRTFVFVREAQKNIAGAEVVFLRMKDHEKWIFPYTNEGGWTKREVPDGNYLVSTKAAGYVTKILYLKIPSGDRFPHRTFTVWLERKR